MSYSNADFNAIRESLLVLMDQADHFEVAAIKEDGRERRVSKRFSWRDIEEAAKHALACTKRPEIKGVYFTLNPLGEGGNKAAKDEDVLRRRLLLVDIDPNRPPDTNSTEDEKVGAWLVACSIKDALAARGWPAPVVVDSGNGYHLLYRIDLPNDDRSRELVKNVLDWLGNRYDNYCAAVDQKVHNAGRISKLPGTWSRKGPHSDERPHRLARLVEMPEPLGVVSEAQLRALVLDQQGNNPFRGKCTGGDGPSIDDRVIAYLASCRAAVSGQNGHSITLSVARGVVWGFDLSPDHGFQLMRDHYNPQCAPPWSDEDLYRKCKQAVDTPDPGGRPRGFQLNQRNPRWQEASSPRSRTSTGSTAGQQESRTGGGRLRVVWLDTVKVEPLRWLVPGFIPLGKLSMIAGDGGQGKSSISLDLAASVTTGRSAWGLNYENPVLAKALFITCEDDLSDTVVARLLAAGADVSRIGHIPGVIEDGKKERMFHLADVDYLRLFLQENPECRLVVIDPVGAYVGGTDDHKDSELRGLLAPLVELASELDVAIVIIKHLNKAVGSSAASRVNGSGGWVNAVRSALLVAKDKDDPDKSLVLVMKSNLARGCAGLACKIKVLDDTEAEVVFAHPSVEHLDHAKRNLLRSNLYRVEWLGETNVSPDEALARPSTRERGQASKEEKAEWLKKYLANGPRWSNGILAAAEREFQGRQPLKMWQSILAECKGKTRMRKAGGRGSPQCWVWYLEGQNPRDWNPADDAEYLLAHPPKQDDQAEAAGLDPETEVF